MFSFFRRPAKRTAPSAGGYRVAAPRIIDPLPKRVWKAVPKHKYWWLAVLLSNALLAVFVYSVRKLIVVRTVNATVVETEWQCTTELGDTRAQTTFMVIGQSMIPITTYYFDVRETAFVWGKVARDYACHRFTASGEERFDAKFLIRFESAQERFTEEKPSVSDLEGVNVGAIYNLKLNIDNEIVQSCPKLVIFSSVAQLVEQVAVNHPVPGSIPGAGAKMKKPFGNADDVRALDHLKRCMCDYGSVLLVPWSRGVDNCVRHGFAQAAFELPTVIGCYVKHGFVITRSGLWKAGVDPASYRLSPPPIYLLSDATPGSFLRQQLHGYEVANLGESIY